MQFNAVWLWEERSSCSITSIPGIIGWKQRHPSPSSLLSSNSPHTQTQTSSTMSQIHYCIVCVALPSDFLEIWCKILYHFNQIITRQHVNYTLNFDKLTPLCQPRFKQIQMQQLLHVDWWAGLCSSVSIGSILPNFFPHRCSAPRQMPNASKWRLILIGESSFAFLPHNHSSSTYSPIFPFPLLVVCLNVCRESKCVGKSDDSVNCTAAGGRGLSYQLTHLPISDPFSNKSAQESATIFYPFCHRLCQFPVVLCWNSLPEVWKQIICCNFCIIRFYFFASVLWKKNQTKYLTTNWFVTLYQKPYH